MKFKLSPSSLNLMNECPRCFWLDKHKVWKRPNGIFPSLPSGMDRILKKHFDNFKIKNELPPELCENGLCKNMKLFDDDAKMKVWQSNFKGVSWIDESGNELHGAVDNILVNGKKLVVLDYKTRGFALKDDTAEHYRQQQNIYNFLLRKNGYETENFLFLLFYIPNKVNSTGEVIFDTELIKMNVDVKSAEQIWKKAIKLLNSECPSNTCDWCHGR